MRFPLPKGPKGEKRPADVIGAAIMVAKIATGEITDDVPTDKEHVRRAGNEGLTRGPHAAAMYGGLTQGSRRSGAESAGA
jgi:hypothetical protein